MGAWFTDSDGVVVDAVTDSHGVVRNSGEGGDESGDDVEETLLLWKG